jgi:hypothetical protein
MLTEFYWIDIINQTKDNLWHTLPDDGYIFSALTWHMEQAGRLSELHNLFREVNTYGRNGWYDDFRSRVLKDAISRMDRKLFKFPAWSEMLHTLSHQDRNKLLEEIPKLLPAIVYLSDRSTLKLVVEAIQEVCEQWP